MLCKRSLVLVSLSVLVCLALYGVASATSVDLDIGTVTEANEMDSGGYVALNDDDDDKSGTADKDDGTTAKVDDENDLVALHFARTGPDRGTFKLIKTVTEGKGDIRVWKSQTRGDTNPENNPDLVPMNQAMNIADFPTTWYVEGYAASGSAMDVELKLEWTLDGQQYTDTIKITVVKVDLDIDSDNDNGFGGPDNSLQEENVEDYGDSQQSPEIPGKYIRTNWRDKDHDSIPDVADGYNRDENADTDDDENPEEEFYPLTIELSDSLLLNGYVQLDYELSDPTQATVNEQVGVWGLQLRRRDTYTVPDNKIRIWLVDSAAEQRDGNKFIRRNPDDSLEGGQIIDPERIYSAADLGLTQSNPRITLYVEGVQDSTQLADTAITLKAWLGDPSASSPPPATVGEDRVRVTVGAPMTLFDTDRDGIIRFGTVSSKETSDYTHPDPQGTSEADRMFRTLNYRFWVNDDHDGHWWYEMTRAKDFFNDDE